jgi:hypothetical protein
MKGGFLDYLSAAFNARPLGMQVPPNWIGLAGFGLAGAINPGFWLIGAGVELGYLFLLATNSRFQRLVDGRHAAREQAQWRERMDKMAGYLDRVEQKRFFDLQTRCKAILDSRTDTGESATAGVETTAAGLARLLWFYLRLLLTRRGIRRVVAGTGGSEPLDEIEKSIAEAKERLEDSTLSEHLRESLQGQLAILKQRLNKRSEAATKLEFIDSELERIEHQVGLIHDESALSSNPEAMAQHINEVAATMDNTNQWIRDQQRIYGDLGDLIAEPPPTIFQPPQKESA